MKHGEAAGSDTAADADGTNPGEAGTGVAFGADGPGSAPAADFDGSADAYISTDVYGTAPTGEGVSIAAWAKVDDLSEDGVIASVEGGVGESGMILGYRSTSATTGQWVLSMPDMGMGAFTSWEVLGGQVTANNQDEWVHLVGVWDDFTGTMTLYVNGVAAGTADRETTWWGDGTVQIGRASSGGTWDGNFDGAIADVRVYDRVVPAGEALELGWQVATRAGYWQFNTVDADTNTSPEYDEGPSAALGGDAHLYYSPSDEDLLLDPTLTTALIGTGHLELDGAGDYASVASPVLDTSASFSLTARVRLSTASPDASMTVLSIAGSNASAIEVAYEPGCGDDSGCWVLRLTTADSTAATVVEVESSIDPTAETQGQTIAVTYDSITGQAVLYVDGYASAAMTDPFLSAWAATGDLQIGRSYTAGADSAYFSGAIDDLRAYSGVLHASVVARLSLNTSDEQPGI